MSVPPAVPLKDFENLRIGLEADDVSFGPLLLPIKRREADISSSVIDGPRCVF
jgi:hypothetical protein